LHGHAEAQLKRKEPGIQQLARKYNKLCDELVVMIEKRKAPRGAVAPHMIERDSLFKLDVDDEIWQDVGLQDDVQDKIPLWLGDDNVRQGIKSLLELDHCQEEEKRLCKEREAMHDWMVEEWECVTEAINLCGTCILNFHHSISNIHIQMWMI